MKVFLSEAAILFNNFSALVKLSWMWEGDDILIVKITLARRIGSPCVNKSSLQTLEGDGRVSPARRHPSRQKLLCQDLQNGKRNDNLVGMSTRMIYKGAPY